MQPGRELDALIAEKVMGLDLRPVEHHYGKPPFSLDPGARNFVGSWTEVPEIKPYSTDIAAAWQVVEKLSAQGWELTLDSNLPENEAVKGYMWAKGWMAVFRKDWKNDWGPKPYSVHIGNSKESAPLAICLAALKTLS